MKALTCLVVLALYYFCNATDPENEPNYLIGEWKLDSVHLDSDPLCCAPNGTVRITNNGDRTITLTSESWTGDGCAGRTSSYKQVFLIDGSKSYKELFPYLLPENTFFDKTSGQGLEFYAHMTDITDDSDHYQYWTQLGLYQYEQFPCDCYSWVTRTRPWGNCWRSSKQCEKLDLD